METQILTYNTLLHSKGAEGWGEPGGCTLGSRSPADCSTVPVSLTPAQKKPQSLTSDFPSVVSTLTLQKFLLVSMSLSKVQMRASVFSKPASLHSCVQGLCSEGYSLPGALQDQGKSPSESSFCFGLTQDLPEPVILSIFFQGLWTRLLRVNSALAAQSTTP